MNTSLEQPQAVTKRPSMRKAINEMCKACIYDPIGGRGTWRQQTEACPTISCPLWPLRPISRTEAQGDALVDDDEKNASSEDEAE
jgi:hypothetical protein